MSTTVSAAQIVTFRLGEDLFAADINDVERVLRYSEPTPVPNVPTWVQGVIEYRSRVVPVIDLRVRFELEATPPAGTTRLMVLSSEGEWIAAVVDAVLEVVPMGTAQLAPPPPLFEGLSAEFLRGILRRKDRLIIVLDIARLLATKDRLAFDRAMLSAAERASEPEAEPVSPVESAFAPAPSESAGAASAAVESDLLIIRGSPDPAASSMLELLGTNEEAPRPDASMMRPVPPTPEWGAPSAPAPQRGPDDPEGGQSDG
jgi:purine-binding chemotaxis protein CheW